MKPIKSKHQLKQIEEKHKNKLDKTTNKKTIIMEDINQRKLDVIDRLSIAKMQLNDETDFQQREQLKKRIDNLKKELMGFYQQTKLK